MFFGTVHGLKVLLVKDSESIGQAAQYLCTLQAIYLLILEMELQIEIQNRASGKNGDKFVANPHSFFCLNVKYSMIVRGLRLPPCCI